MGKIANTLHQSTLGGLNLSQREFSSTIKLAQNAGSNLQAGSGSCPVVSECKEIGQGIAKGDFKKVSLNGAILGLSTMNGLGGSSKTTALSKTSFVANVGGITSASQVLKNSEDQQGSSGAQSDKRDQVFVIGNPLLDISVEMNDDALTKKYDLQPGLACLANEKQMPIYDELWDMEGRTTIPGGSAMNTARATNYYLKNKTKGGRVTYFGAIGADPKGEVLRKEIADSGIAGHFHVETETPTGTCAVVIQNKDRSLCANLAAACKYSPNHLAQNMDELARAQIIYTTSFFITSSSESLMNVARYATENRIPFAFNLSAVFLLEFELPKVLAALKHADYVFCNEDETAAFAKARGMPEDSTVSEIALAIANFEKTGGGQRVAILTNGCEPVVLACGELVQEYPVPQLAADQIIDTNGAGDAFVGGFLSEFVLDKSIDACVRAGIRLSQEIVKRSGCTFPPQQLDFLSFLDRQKFMILDGGIATQTDDNSAETRQPLQAAKLIHEDPVLVEQLHYDSYAAGADVAITASYRASFELFDMEGYSYELSCSLFQNSILLAQKARDRFWNTMDKDQTERQRPLVAASVGCYGAMMENGADQTGDYEDLTLAELIVWHRRRLEQLSQTEADIYACETVPNIMEVEALMIVMKEYKDLKFWIACACKDSERLNSGELYSRAIEMIEDNDEFNQVVAVGINCSPPQYVSALIEATKKVSQKEILVYPNSVDKQGIVYKIGQQSFEDYAVEWYKQGARIIGGCCQVDLNHITNLRQQIVNNISQNEN